MQTFSAFFAEKHEKVVPRDKSIWLFPRSFKKNLFFILLFFLMNKYNKDNRLLSFYLASILQ